jgi:outer membrane protein assembly factor BamA
MSQKLFFCSLLCFLVAVVAAQNIDVSTTAANKLLNNNTDTAAKVLVHSINIAGNKRTKEYIILREIQIKPGDSVKISTLNIELQKARQQVYNISLFNEVKIEVDLTASNDIDINFTVKERWYIFPIPKFQLVDRNINEWIQKYDADLDRVVYGGKFTHYNLTGRRDQLRLILLNGFTRTISLSYSQPFSNKALTNGFSFTAGLIENREYIYKIGYDNKPLLFNNGAFSRKNIFIGAGFTIRKNILYSHAFNITYNYLQVTDSLLNVAYNPYYLKGTGTERNYTDISYTWQYINANNVKYPLKGETASFKALKRGLGLTGGLNMFFVDANFNKYWDLHKTWYASINLSGKTTLPFNQPYINQRAMGYGENYLRGLELYVVDGVAFGMIRSTLKKKLFTINFPLPFKSKKYPTIPFTFFAKTYADLGYTYNKKAFETNLNNKLLYSGGFGIDVLTFYDINLRIEYSFNQLGKNGLFLQAQSGL